MTWRQRMTWRQIFRLPETIVGRAVLILTIALIMLHLVSYWTYRIGTQDLAMTARDRGLAERMVSIKRAIAEIPGVQERDRTAHSLASASLDIHWSKVSLVLSNAPMTPRAAAMSERLKALAPELSAESFRVGFADDGVLDASAGGAYQHMMLASIRLPDGSWINFASPTFGVAHGADHWGGILAFCMALGVVLVSLILLRRVTRPLTVLAKAADAFTLDGKTDPLDESGPTEVRQAARAFNAMRERIQRLVVERTQALAAVSHDLRTPITRLRLRAELLDDDANRMLMEADLAEMEAMINATLDYLRGGISGETMRQLDLSALLQTLVDDVADRGHEITLSGAAHVLMMGQSIALKRLFANLISNALAYGGAVAVSIHTGRNDISVTLDDNGPGIAPEDRERAFEPFVRLEASRSRETGGTGLGLTIARSVAIAHGGSISLAQSPNGGLRVVVMLPLG